MTINLQKRSDVNLSNEAPGMTCVIRKLANALVGGLWVGGTVEITQKGLSFVPNALNRAFMSRPDPISLPSADIHSVGYEFGWFTGIVVVSHRCGEFRFRCYGAKQVVATMAASLNAI